MDDSKDTQTTIMLPGKWFIILFVVLAIALQSMIMWKVVGLEKEKIAITQQRDELEKNKANYSELIQKIPELENREKSLQNSILSITNEKKALEDEYNSIKEAKFRAEETIAKSKEAKKINTELTEAVDNLKKEIDNKVVEIKSLTTPNSALMQSAGTLSTIVKQLEEQPSSFKQTLNQALVKVDDSAKSIITVSDKLTEQSKLVLTASETTTSHLKEVAKNAENAINSVKETDKTLKLHTQSFSEQLVLLNKRITEIETNNTKISEQIKHLMDISQKVSDASDKVQGVSIKTQESADNFEKKINDISFESEKTLLEERIGELETNNKNATANILELTNIIKKISGNQKNIQATSENITKSSSDFEKKIQAVSFQDEKTLLLTQIKQIGENNSTMKLQIQELQTITPKLSSLADNTIADFTKKSGQLASVKKEFDLIVTGLNQAMKNTFNAVDQFKEKIGAYTESLTSTELEQLNNKVKTELSKITEYSNSVKNNFSQLTTKIEELNKVMESKSPEKTSNNKTKTGEPE
ncbi:MAG: hypothetical protein HQK79_03145 [Desulfobacterales bacterium]|nr:hypothetical protein [Desulfobacterales bacterium]